LGVDVKKFVIRMIVASRVWRAASWCRMKEGWTNRWMNKWTDRHEDGWADGRTKDRQMKK